MKPRVNWIPVERELPKDGHNILIVTDHEYIWTGWRKGEDWFADCATEPLHGQVTHWADLPDLPA